MEFITVEQFKEQPIEVQKLFLDWWKPSIGDLVNIVVWQHNIKRNEVGIVDDLAMSYANDTVKNDSEWTVKEWIQEYVGEIPLLTEGQLRNFIEDKTKFPIKKIGLVNDGYEIYTEYKAIDNYSDIWFCDKLGNDLFQAYWKVACMVAKEGLDV